MTIWPKDLGEPEESWLEYENIDHGVQNYTLLMIRAEVVIEDILDRLEQTDVSLDVAEGEAAALKDELVRVKGRMKLAEKQRDRAEKNMDGFVHMARNAEGLGEYTVVTAEDGFPSIQPMNWKERAEKAEARELKLMGMLEESWYFACAKHDAYDETDYLLDLSSRYDNRDAEGIEA